MNRFARAILHIKHTTQDLLDSTGNMFRVLLVCALLVVAHGAPATKNPVTVSSEEKHPDIVIVPLHRPLVPDFSRYDASYEDSDEEPKYGHGGFFRPVLIDPFSGFFGGFSDLFHRLHNNMNGFFDTVPANPFNKVYNTTTTTKIVDGHKITINKTIYHNENEDGSLQVQVVQVRPLEDDTEQVSPEQPTTTQQSVEDNSQDNEIAKEEMEDNSDVEIMEPEVFERDSWNKYRDLRQDINVNQVKSQAIQRKHLLPKSVRKTTRTGQMEQQAVMDPNVEMF